MATNSSAVAAAAVISGCIRGAESQSKAVKDFPEGIADDDENTTQGKPWVVAGEVSDESGPTPKTKHVSVPESTQATPGSAMDGNAVGAARGISAVSESTIIEEDLPLPLSYLLNQPGCPHPLHIPLPFNLTWFRRSRPHKDLHPFPPPPLPRPTPYFPVLSDLPPVHPRFLAPEPRTVLLPRWAL